MNSHQTGKVLMVYQKQIRHVAALLTGTVHVGLLSESYRGIVPHRSELSCFSAEDELCSVRCSDAKMSPPSSWLDSLVDMFPV